MSWPSTLILHYGATGDRVRRLQRALTDGRYGKFHPGPVDGQFGPRTAAAVHEAKWLLGYEKRYVNDAAGLRLVEYLENKRQLTDAMRERRRARLAAAAEEAARVPMRVKALNYAKADLGLREGGGNRIKYNEWWCGGTSDGAPYCVRAGSYWYAKAGSEAVKRGVRWQGTDALLYDAMHRRNGVHLTGDPAPGDGFVIDFSGHSDPDHFGLFVARISSTTFKAVEANTGLAGGGEGVGYKSRPMGNCWFIRYER